MPWGTGYLTANTTLWGEIKAWSSGQRFFTIIGNIMSIFLYFDLKKYKIY
jgi:hypothetical protein